MSAHADRHDGAACRHADPNLFFSVADSGPALRQIDKDAPDRLAAVVAKAEAGGVRAVEVAALRRRLSQLSEQQAGYLPGEALESLADLPRLDELPDPPPGQARDVLDRLVVVKLNGGLHGTSMGLSGPKSLLQVKSGASFLDVFATQVLALRDRHGARLPLVLMNSAATRGPSLDYLSRYDGLRVPGVPLDFLQGREPKIRADDLRPVAWPADPGWSGARPGTATSTPRWRRPAPWRPCSAPGCATPSCPTPTTSARSPTPESPHGWPPSRCRSRWRRCAARLRDRKGGHLARYQGRVVLRETAQVPDGDTSFTDVERWRWYNTNNIWIDLRVLRELQAADPAAPALPLIVNRKTVDPRHPASTPVIQLESAMGAAIGSIPGARAIHVPRSRFAPVKTTDDLLVLRSDAYQLTSDGRMRPAFDGPGPVVTLDKDFYKLLPDFDQRFPAGPPSLRRCRRFQVDGDVTFGAAVTAVGHVRLVGPYRVPDGEVLGG